MSHRSYPIPMEDFRHVLTLSHLSLVEIARRFGVSRSNLMGVLGGGRTLGDERLLQLVDWAGLDVDVAGQLHLAAGIHFWKIASETQMEAFAHLPTEIFPKKVSWSVALEFPLREQDWMHLIAEIGETCWVLLSVRPVFYALLRDRIPGVGRPQKLASLQKTLTEIIAAPGAQGMHVAWAEPSPILGWATPELRATHAQPLADWMALARQKWALDTSEIGEPYDLPTTAAHDAQNDQVPCQQAWAWLAHRLDVAGAAHQDVTDLPVFSLEAIHHYPISMVRMDRIWLGDTLLQLGKAGRLRCYVRADGAAWVVLVSPTTLPCGLPQPWTTPPAAERYLIVQNQTLEIATHIGTHEHCIGPVVASWNRGTNYG